MASKLLLLCILLCSCTTTRMIQTDLYFGLSKPDGGMVTEEEWQSFKENEIARVFKEGSTVLDGVGNWHDSNRNKLITEPTYVVTYFHKKTPQLSNQIDSLRYRYKILFQQQSVLRVDKKVKATF